MIHEDKHLEKQAEIYLKLKPFIRRSGNRLIWDPQTDVVFAPTFEQFLALQDRPVLTERCHPERIFPIYSQEIGRALRDGQTETVAGEDK